MFSLKTFAVLAAAVTSSMAQDAPNPPLGGSDCRIQAEAGFHFTQVVLRTLINYDEICATFKDEINVSCHDTTVTCERDINSPQLKYFFFETDSECDGPAVESAISRATGESDPICNLSG